MRALIRALDARRSAIGKSMFVLDHRRTMRGSWMDVRELDHELDAPELGVRALDAREVEACVRVLDARALSAQALHGRVLNRVGAR